MPEGPEVKTVAKTLLARLGGKELGSLWHSHLPLRRHVDYGALKRFENSIIDGIETHGKVLFFTINKKTAIMAQLGMTGQLKVQEIDEPLLPHTHLRWQLKSSNFELRYVDPRRFGLIEACDEDLKARLIKKLGPDPFTLKREDFLKLASSMARSLRAIKEVLLDQKIIAGIGNIYASEALFKAGIHPLRKASLITENEYEKLIIAVIEVLKEAFRNSGTSFSNYVDGNGQKGNNQAFLQVFQRESLPCMSCKTLIERIKQGGRSTFFCPSCQN
jgi:formamidopyrimidine-DNA glycosylase